MLSTYQELYDFGDNFLSPSLTVYLQSVLDSSSGKRIVCLAREGWLFKQLLERLSIEGIAKYQYQPVYLQVSRTLMSHILITEPTALDIIFNSTFNGSVQDLLINRFCLTKEEVFEIFSKADLNREVILPQDSELIKEILLSKKAPLDQLTSKMRNDYLNYLDTLGICDSNIPILFLDLGYSGTIQKLLTYMIGRNTDGLYYIAKNAGEKRVGENIAGIYGAFYENVSWESDVTMLDRSMFLEILLTANHGQVQGIYQLNDKSFKFSYGKLANTQLYIQDLKAIVEGAIDGTVKNFHNGITFTNEEVADIYEVYVTKAGAIPRSIRPLFTFDDNYTGNGVVNALDFFSI